MNPDQRSAQKTGGSYRGCSMNSILFLVGIESCCARQAEWFLTVDSCLLWRKEKSDCRHKLSVYWIMCGFTSLGIRHS